uniref:Uncharacterized protein n=1 Tax=Anguilla anguilla TaxID=7936 RepID=A0A0E9RLP8_ANGAN
MHQSSSNFAPAVFSASTRSALSAQVIVSCGKTKYIYKELSIRTQRVFSIMNTTYLQA